MYIYKDMMININSIFMTEYATLQGSSSKGQSTIQIRGDAE